MRDSIRGFALIVLFAMGSCGAAAGVDKDLEITIHLYDYSGLDSSAVADTRRAADDVFRRAGIAARWSHCLPSALRSARAHGCNAGSHAARHLILSVLPERMTAKIATGPKLFGISTARGDGGFPTQAYLFLDRIVNFAAAEQASWASLLGMFIAHEVGHLLLGNNSHSTIGVMRAQWNSEDIKHALMGALSFTPQQAKQMRSEVVRRMNQELR